MQTQNDIQSEIPGRDNSSQNTRISCNIVVEVREDSRFARADDRARHDVFESIISPHQESLYLQARSLTQSVSDAEDLVQDTLVRAYDRFETFRYDGSPGGWLQKIMRNLFINAYWKRSREPKRVWIESFDLAINSDSGSANGMGQVVGPRQLAVSSVEHLVLSNMEYAAIVRAVCRLPEPYRVVVALVGIYGLAYQEAADQLQIPVGTVRSRVSRGRERIHRAIFGTYKSGETTTNAFPA